MKWDGVKSVWGRDDLLPMWVADMDFRTPPFVMEALRKRLEHEVLGYTSACEEWYTSICSWLSRRHGWDVTREMLTFVPGIVRGQAFALQCFTNPGILNVLLGAMKVREFCAAAPETVAKGWCL